MLTRRTFRELTDRALFGPSLKPKCFCPIASHKSTVQSTPCHPGPTRYSSSSTRWKSRQTRDKYSKEAKVQGLKSRAAFKLLEIDGKYKLFKPGQTVIDLGYAPGSWSQVAVSRTQPDGRVIGIDILPVQPPQGVSTIQGNFLSEEVRREVRAYVQDASRGRARMRIMNPPSSSATDEDGIDPEWDSVGRSYVEMERSAHLDTSDEAEMGGPMEGVAALSVKGRDEAEGRVVDVVLSDMCAPWAQTTGTWIKSVSDPYRRMMNTSGIGFKDHADSMDLCLAALTFSFDTLRTGGHFVCKFYQGGEDKSFELRLRKLFEKVHREKPESSRAESKEGFFVALRRKDGVRREDVLGE